MNIQWTSKSLSDLARLHDFLALVNGSAAAKTVRDIISGAGRLLANPRLGERLDEFEPREVRRILVGHYEIRYEVYGSSILILRIWHTREHR